MGYDKHQVVGRHILQILLHPCQDALVHIAYVLVVAVHIEVVVDDDVVCLALVERVVRGAEILLERLEGVLPGTSTVGHIVVAYGAVDGHAELRHRVYVGGEELGGVAHNVAAVYGEKVGLATILLQVGVHVIQVFAVEGYLLLAGHLRVGLHGEEMLLVVYPVLGQLEVVDFVCRVYLLIKLPDGLVLAGHLIACRGGEVDKAGTAVTLQSIGTVLAGGHTVYAVGHDYAGHALAVAGHFAAIRIGGTQ